MSLIMGNCFDVMQTLDTESVDLILCDPPYGINYIDNVALHYKKHRGEEVTPQPIINDSKDSINWSKFLEFSYRVLKNNKMIYICCRTDMILSISNCINNSKFSYIHDIIWHKGDMGYGNLNIMGTTHELVIGLCKGKPEKSRILVVDGKEKKRTPAFYSGKLRKKEYYGHPTQKPVGLMAYIILNRTDPGDLVLDPFSGVGSTLVASLLLHREFLGIEIDEDHYKKTLKRLEDAQHLDMYRKMFSNGLVKVNNGGVKFDIDCSDQNKLF